MQQLKISSNNTGFVTEDGKPFFWLADTAWELLHRCTYEETRYYFSARQAQGFNVVLTVLLPELDGLRVPNQQGDVPLIEMNPSKPNKNYFSYVDTIVALAESMNFYMGLLPTWGDKVHKRWGIGPVVFDKSNAYAYGQYLGQRYGKRSNIIWVLGGDREANGENGDFRDVWRVMATGIREYAPTALMTYHPCGGYSSS
ncbi:MAG: DUF4038 domain-containing protein, partial [Chloroflexota bacterium]